MLQPAPAVASPTGTISAPPIAADRNTIRNVLLACGIAAALLYVAMLVFIPLLWDSYSSADQMVSELSAIDAPTRLIWVPLGTLYTVLIVAFGWGIWLTAGENRRLRVVGAALIAYGVFGLFWPPMHLRGAGFTLTDTLHIVWTMVSLLLMLLAMGFGAAALGRRFRFYAITTMGLMIAGGALAGVAAPDVQANLPTPGIGVWQRMNIGVTMLWLIVLALALLRRPRLAPPGARP